MLQMSSWTILFINDVINFKLQGTADTRLRLRRNKSLSPHPDRPKSEISVRWADGDSGDYDITETTVKLRNKSTRDRPRPKSDLGKLRLFNWHLLFDICFFLCLLVKSKCLGFYFHITGISMFWWQTGAATCSVINIFIKLCVAMVLALI